MPRLRNFLERFRPAGAPGSMAVGVPVDRGTALAAELEPVFALLGAVEDECRLIVERAEAEAEAVRGEAEERAAAIVAAARAGAAAERAAEAARVKSATVRDLESEIASAGERARRVRDTAAERLPRLVERAISAVGAPLSGGTVRRRDVGGAGV